MREKNDGSSEFMHTINAGVCVKSVFVLCVCVCQLAQSLFIFSLLPTVKRVVIMRNYRFSTSSESTILKARSISSCSSLCSCHMWGVRQRGWIIGTGDLFARGVTEIEGGGGRKREIWGDMWEVGGFQELCSINRLIWGGRE